MGPRKLELLLMNTPTEKSKFAVLYVDDEEQALRD